MKKILGTRDQYYDQTNNAQVYLFDDYFKKKKMISCGPETFAMGLDNREWPMDVFTPGEQPGDSILMIAHNPFNLPKFKDVRDIDYDLYPPNEVPQLYPVISKIIYNRDDVCEFRWGLTFDIIRDKIENDTCLMVSGSFPCGGHYVLIVGYDGDKIIFNDPYPPQWPDKNGYNRVMTQDFFEKNIKPNGYRIEIYPSPIYQEALKL